MTLPAGQLTEDRLGSSLSWIESHPVVPVDVDALVLRDSPRRAGEDTQHVQTLAEAAGELPPITVHRPTMRVIDGAHRVQAARLAGRTRIEARLVDCDEQAAFVLAVRANVTHGLPLSRDDRAAAAARIIASHPHWSDRAVAAATALSDKTVSRIRARQLASTGTTATVTRLGRDGRLRPVDSGDRRERAAAVIRRQPQAGLREVARITGLSPATVRDVRARLDRGEHPVPDRYRRNPTSEPEPGPAPRPPVTGRAGGVPVVEAQVLLGMLANDPALRHSEAGRQALRLLHRCLVGHDHLAHLSRGLPDRWAPHVASLARTCATAWQDLAEQLQRRAAG